MDAMEMSEEDKTLREMVEFLTMCGTTDFDKDKLKSLKKLCRKSDGNITLVFNELFAQLHKKHSEIRLSTVYLLNEFFTRSHVFRELVIDEIQTIFDLTITSTKPLPPPKYAAKLVKEKMKEIFKQWHETYNESYIRLALAHRFFPTTQIVVTQRQIQNNNLLNEQETAARIQEEEIRKLIREINEALPEIYDCVNAVESCFRILVPHFYDDNEKVIDVDNSEIVRKSTTIQLEINPQTMRKVTVKKDQDNSVILENLKERITVLRKKYKKVTTWRKKLAGSDSSEKIYELSKLMITIKTCLNKDTDLKIMSDTEDEFEEVPEKEYQILLQKQEADDKMEQSNEVAEVSKPQKINKFIPTMDQPSTSKNINVWTPLREDDDISDPTSYSRALKNFMKVRTSKEEKQELCKMSNYDDEPGTSKGSLKDVAPVVPYGHDLLEWDPQGMKEMKQNISTGSAKELDIGHRFWSSNDNGSKSVCDAAISSLTSRTYAFTGEFEPVKWSCRAPLPNGKLCPRMDRKKCPFHGQIILRNEDGSPSNPEDAKRLNKIEAEKEKDKVPDWQDPKLLAELKEKTGIDLKMPEKGRRKKKKKYENLTDISKSVTSKSRLQNKVLSKQAMKRVSSVMDKIEAKKSYDKFGNNFNYAITK